MRNPGILKTKASTREEEKMSKSIQLSAIPQSQFEQK